MDLTKSPTFEVSPIKVSTYMAMEGTKDVSFSVTIAPYLVHGINELIKDVLSTIHEHLTILYPKYSLGISLSMNSLSRLHTIVFTIYDVPTYETYQVSEFLSGYINNKFLDKLYKSKLERNSGE